MPGVVTMVSATVPPDRADDLVDAFGAALRRGMPERRHTSLLRGEGDLWRIVTFWHSRGDLDRYLETAERPFAAALLASVGGTPRVDILEVVLDSTVTWWP